MKEYIPRDVPRENVLLLPHDTRHDSEIPTADCLASRRFGRRAKTWVGGVTVIH